ncbi:hypothetical protein [Nocardia gipuzkoensis]|nr:hypothetical protein [Nocardia gipuzkoensis]
MNFTPLGVLVREDALVGESTLLERPIGISRTEPATDPHGHQVA